MSKSGRKFRNPNALDARKRKAGPHESTKRLSIEELRQKEIDDELQDAWHGERPCKKQWHFDPDTEKPDYCECGVPTFMHGGML